MLRVKRVVAGQHVALGDGVDEERHLHDETGDERRRLARPRDAVALDTDTRGVDVQWSENATADSIGKNLEFARCEGRYAASVFSPLGVVSLDLTP